jgi:hypothetical protein
VLGILGSFLVAAVLAVPVLAVARRPRRITWTAAVVLGTVLFAIGILLIADIPSRILYLFSSQHANWARHVPWLPILKGDNYTVIADVVANTVQGIFFVAIVALTYVWGERQRRAGRFK